MKQTMARTDACTVSRIGAAPAGMLRAAGAHHRPPLAVLCCSTVQLDNTTTALCALCAFSG